MSDQQKTLKAFAFSVLFRSLNQFNNCYWSSIALTKSELDDAGIAAVTVGILLSDFIEQFLGYCLVHYEAFCLTASVKIASLSEGNHLVCSLTQFFSLSFCSLNTTILEKSGYQAAENGFTWSAGSSYFAVSPVFPPK